MSEARPCLGPFENLRVVIAERDFAVAAPAVPIVRSHGNVALRFEKACQPMPILTAQPGGGRNPSPDCGFTAKFACHPRFFDVDT
jgi:hypothetical protein